METKARRVPAWKILGGFLAALALAAGAVVFWVRSVADRGWADMESRVAELKAEVERRPPARPLLRGEAVAGNAWDDYMAAAATLPKGIVPTPLPAFLNRDNNANVATVRDFVFAHDKALDLIRAGTRRAEVRPSFHWDQGYLPVDFDQGPAMTFRDLGACKSRFLREEHRVREAMELLLDLAQFGRDLCQNTYPETECLGLWTWDRVGDELADLVTARTLSPEERRDLDRELAILDGNWPNPEAGMLNQSLVLGSGLMQEVKMGSLLYGTPDERYLYSWRWAFSSRLRASSTFTRVDQWSREALHAQESTWSEEQRVCADLLEQVSSWLEPIVRWTAADPFKFPHRRRDVRSRLRLLRTAVHFSVTGEVLPLADPFGGQIHPVVREGRLKVWSVGQDGVDDGGDGGWRGGKDIVLEVER
jgi:hypothetical protein